MATDSQMCCPPPTSRTGTCAKGEIDRKAKDFKSPFAIDKVFRCNGIRQNPASSRTFHALPERCVS